MFVGLQVSIIPSSDLVIILRRLGHVLIEIDVTVVHVDVLDLAIRRARVTANTHPLHLVYWYPIISWSRRVSSRKKMIPRIVWWSVLLDRKTKHSEKETEKTLNKQKHSVIRALRTGSNPRMKAPRLVMLGQL